MTPPSHDDSIRSAIETALEHHHAGRLDKAEAIYRQVLGSDPDHPDALDLLGMIAFQRGKNETAIELVRRAIGRDASNPAYHHDLGAVFQRQGRLEEAVACYRNALAIRSSFADAHFDLGNALSALGKLDEAVTSYRSVLSLNADDSEAYNNLATALQRQGKLDEAVDTYRKALSLAPDSSTFHYNLGNTLRDQGKLDEAVACYIKALSIEPANPSVQLNLGAVLHSQGNIGEAIAHYEEALAIKPDYAEAYFNMGRALQGGARLDEAMACYRKALSFKPNYADAHNELGNALVARGDLVNAVACYGNAIASQPDFAEAHSNLGNALQRLGRVDAAMASHRRALEIRETPEIKMNVARCLREMDFDRADPAIRLLVARAVSEPWARPVDLARASIRAIRSDSAINTLIERVSADRAPEADRCPIFGSTELEVLSRDATLRALLENAPACDVALERLLTAVRRTLLDAADTADCSGDPDEETLRFYCALARQCFITEFVFACTDEELRRVSALREKVLAAIGCDAAVPIIRLVAVAAYLPLFSLPGVEILLQRTWPEPVVALLMQQVAEPQEERRIRASIPAITAIEGRVSRQVRQQYEENPYPRWVKSNPPLTPLHINEYLRQHFPLAPFRPLDEAMSIELLAAGCGTGQESIEAAQQIIGARVLAVDLSLSSLCYAKRKTQEMGLQNVEYAQADITNLRSIGRTFDVVQSFGVLHHMADPSEGLRILLSLVRPGGLMFLGLYSERARRTIVAARRYISQHGYASTPSDIRRCRQDLMSLEGGSHFRELTAFSDFYSISECRDLLFHVQEHRFTIPQIKHLLGDLNLQFVGFLVKPRVLSEYRARFPDDEAGTNLDHWAQFENEFPNTFIGTYAFWVQRPG